MLSSNLKRITTAVSGVIEALVDESNEREDRSSVSAPPPNAFKTAETKNVDLETSLSTTESPLETAETGDVDLEVPPSNTEEIPKTAETDCVDLKDSTPIINTSLKTAETKNVDRDASAITAESSLQTAETGDVDPQDLPSTAQSTIETAKTIIGPNISQNDLFTYCATDSNDIGPSSRQVVKNICLELVTFTLTLTLEDGSSFTFEDQTKVQKILDNAEVFNKNIVAEDNKAMVEIHLDPMNKINRYEFPA